VRWAAGYRVSIEKPHGFLLQCGIESGGFAEQRVPFRGRADQEFGRDRRREGVIVERPLGKGAVGLGDDHDQVEIAADTGGSAGMGAETTNPQHLRMIEGNPRGPLGCGVEDHCEVRPAQRAGIERSHGNT
jgi:hypothetical protein